MTIEVAGYTYRWFDSMLIVVPVGSDKPLYIYTPSACIYRDGSKRYYCYTEELLKRKEKNIVSMSYNPDVKYGMDCDGTASSIEYGSGGNAGVPKNVNYWARRNDDEKVSKARNAADWGGFAEAICSIAKPMYDPVKGGEE